MGYCEEVWVSDYTYNGLFEWIVDTNALPKMFEVLTTWRSLFILTTGEIRLSRSYELGVPPSGALKTIELLDFDEEAVGTTTGYFTGFDHLPGGMVLFPDPPDDVYFVSLEGSQPIPL
jgi:hypothetical protein